MKGDALSAGFLLLVLGIGGMIWWARKPRVDRERLFGGLAGG